MLSAQRVWVAAIQCRFVGPRAPLARPAEPSAWRVFRFRPTDAVRAIRRSGGCGVPNFGDEAFSDRIGRAASAAAPRASAYWRYVAIDATTIRLSTVTRSTPTTASRTQASMTMPLSRTRSITSARSPSAMRLVRVSPSSVMSMFRLRAQTSRTGRWTSDPSERSSSRTKRGGPRREEPVGHYLASRT